MVAESIQLEKSTEWILRRTGEALVSYDCRRLPAVDEGQHGHGCRSGGGKMLIEVLSAAKVETLEVNEIYRHDKANGNRWSSLYVAGWAEVVHRVCAMGVQFHVRSIVDGTDEA